MNQIQNFVRERKEEMEKSHGTKMRWLLTVYDLVIWFFLCAMFLFVYPSAVDRLSVGDRVLQTVIGAVCMLAGRFSMRIYRQIWRYSNVTTYLKLIIGDAIGAALFLLFRAVLPIHRMTFMRMSALLACNLLFSITQRILYQYLYQDYHQNFIHKTLRKIITALTGVQFNTAGLPIPSSNRIKIAIVGASRVGTLLAEEMLTNPRAAYQPVCFIDINNEKAGRAIYDLPVLSDEKVTPKMLADRSVQEIVFAMTNMDTEIKRKLYERYHNMGCKLKVYDFPTMQAAETGKRSLREFDIEELLFRRVVEFSDEKTKAYYTGKTILITGGGGSIGSELCRQLAKFDPKQLIILDIYENGAYDVQQELKIAYQGKLNLQIEIASVCSREDMEKVFERYHPDIVLHAAAHKHVPLMEHNVCEAVRNNVFGTLVTVETAEKFGTGRFIMVSTDKAVNPTNVMGATKRMCEMIVLNHAGRMHTSATRFGNVLGSAGSVIPLFKRQIMNGGPITLTDKRIIRYFMTIPEASQLVLQSGAMAKPGELFVLDMGRPIKILELAESMIRLSGFEPYKDIDIIETGLRPGEKLYEELLIKNEQLSKTENSLIFIEKDAQLSENEVRAKLVMLKNALDTMNDDLTREALRDAVPTYHDPREVNAAVKDPEKMAG